MHAEVTDCRHGLVILALVWVIVSCSGCTEEKAASAVEPVEEQGSEEAVASTNTPVDLVAQIREAAEKGNVRSIFLLGYRYERGNEVPQDYKEAAKLYRKAADKGNTEAMFHLGRMYAGGYGVPQDYAESYKWLTLSVVNGQNREAAKLRDTIQRSIMTPAQIEAGQQASRKWQSESVSKM